MGRQVKVIKLASSEKEVLSLGYKTGAVKYSQRCHIILLKNQGLKTKEIAKLLDIAPASVSKWTQRYEKEGLSGLLTRKGQGRKTILNKEEDGEIVKKKVQKERQRLKLAKDDLEKELNKEFSLKTLKRFLKNLTADGNGYV